VRMGRRDDHRALSALCLRLCLQAPPLACRRARSARRRHRQRPGCHASAVRARSVHVFHDHLRSDHEIGRVRTTSTAGGRAAPGANGYQGTCGGAVPGGAPAAALSCPQRPLRGLPGCVPRSRASPRPQRPPERGQRATQGRYTPSCTHRPAPAARHALDRASASRDICSLGARRHTVRRLLPAWLPGAWGTGLGRHPGRSPDRRTDRTGHRAISLREDQPALRNQPALRAVRRSLVPAQVTTAAARVRPVPACSVAGSARRPR